MATDEESRMYSLTVLISGNGTNLQALIDACGKAPLQNARITRVISNKGAAFGLTRAQNASIPTKYHNLVSGGYKKKYPDDVQKAREEYDIDLANIITQDQPKPDLVVCAGWMHILSPKFIDALTAANVPIINLHPALPTQFDGANAIGRAWEAYQKGDIAVTGVMIHYVISEVDRGEPIIVEEVECRGCDTESALEERIHGVEWKLVVQGTAKALSNIQSKERGG
ncbi:Bifunctional purine biosynthetic protein ADE5,7 [Neophaeococcomyces mojaviensis]|uniref:Bifunctional purine biosynthetic protein ADE5,7 n=1 Tax=Neophaeococcomyces mojaviensis TaxID=3383035 RepID=A0ACC2ZVR9_9EURO|nr:Bifunctional purine biosynthetic protein ADE5,7 [Knufia sp. JES_112]